MKPKIKWGLVAMVPLALFLGFGRWLGAFLGLTGLGYRLFWIGFGLLGAIVGGVIFWFLARMHSGKEAKATDPLEEDLNARLTEIRNRLKVAKRPPLESLPSVLIVGPPQSGKSSSVLGSEVEAEQLTGDPIRGGEIPPTRSINAWYSDGTLFVEAGEELRSHPTLWTAFLKKMRPRRLLAAILMGKPQATRAAIVCFGYEEFSKDGALEAAREWARTLRGSLLGMSQALGAQVPVYVLFTKADGEPSFSEYSRQLKEAAERQVLGSTLLPPSSYEVSTYAGRQSRALKQVFDGIFRSLALKRLKFLSPELEPADAGRVYEFPREFGKVSDLASEFLVELCKPSQLQVSPFLRGFYVIGRQEIVLAGSPPPPAEERAEPLATAGATQIFDVSSLAASPHSAPVFEPRQSQIRHRWLFLPRVFRDVILRDDIAVGMMRRGQKVSLGRKVLLVTTTFVVLFFLAPLLVGRFAQGKRIQRDMDQALLEVRTVTSQDARDNEEFLRKLDAVRGKADTLYAQASQRSWFRSLWRFGLSPAQQLYPEVVERYSEWFRPLVLMPALDSLEAELGALTEPPTPTADYQATYDRLRAYLMSTTNRDQGEPEFLATVLAAHLPSVHGEDERTLAYAQFEFFGRNLRGDARFTVPPEEGSLIDSSRRYLAQLGTAEPFYQSLKNKANEEYREAAVDFEGTSRAVRTPIEVPGAFSPGGRLYVKTLLTESDSLPQAEDWVIGPSTPIDVGPLVDEIGSMYDQDFSDQWENLLLRTSVPWFQSAAEAEEILGELSAGEDSPLYELLEIVHQRVDLMAEDHRPRFHALRVILEEDTLGGAIGFSPNANSYLAALEELGAAMGNLASARGEERVDEAVAIRDGDLLENARDAVRRLERDMNRGRERTRLATHLASLFEQPINHASSVVLREVPRELNAWGEAFCSQYDSLVGSKYPFDPNSPVESTLEDLSEIFKPGGSRLWSFQDQLGEYIGWYGDSYGIVQGAETRINPALIDFLTNARRFAEAIFGNGENGPRIVFSLLGELDQSDTQVRTINLQASDVTNVCLPRNCRSLAPIQWTGSEDMGLHLSVTLEGEPRAVAITEFPTGLWAPFRFFSETSGWRAAQEGEHTVMWPLPGIDGTVAVTVSDLAGRAVWVFNPAVMRGLECVSTVVGGR